MSIRLTIQQPGPPAPLALAVDPATGFPTLACAAGFGINGQTAYFAPSGTIGGQAASIGLTQAGFWALILVGGGQGGYRLKEPRPGLSADDLHAISERVLAAAARKPPWLSHDDLDRIAERVEAVAARKRPEGLSDGDLEAIAARVRSAVRAPLGLSADDLRLIAERVEAGRRRKPSKGLSTGDFEAIADRVRAAATPKAPPGISQDDLAAIRERMRSAALARSERLRRTVSITRRQYRCECGMPVEGRARSCPACVSAAARQTVKKLLARGFAAEDAAAALHVSIHRLRAIRAQIERQGAAKRMSARRGPLVTGRVT